MYHRIKHLIGFVLLTYFSISSKYLREVIDKAFKRLSLILIVF